MTPAMLIPDQIAALTAQLDAALAQRDEALLRHTNALRHIQQQSDAMRVMAGEHQIALAEIRSLRDQQHANEPEGLALEHLARMAGFTDQGLDDPAPPWEATTTGHVMPAQALRHAKQAIGLLW